MDRFLNKARGHGNVVLNIWGRAVDDLSAFARGYHQAGKALVKKLADARGYADYEGYPFFVPPCS